MAWYSKNMAWCSKKYLNSDFSEWTVRQWINTQTFEPALFIVLGQWNMESFWFYGGYYRAGGSSESCGQANGNSIMDISTFIAKKVEYKDIV